MTIKKNRIWIASLILIIIEQGIKLFINKNYLEASIPILPPWLYLQPVFNRHYSWYNSMMQLGGGRIAHIAIVLMILVLVYLFYGFIRNKGYGTLLVDAAFAFIFAGGICSLIDKVFWNGSLDYILVRGFFTFDLKDVYINVFNGLLILIVAIDYKGIRKVNEGEVASSFVQYCKGVLFRRSS